MNTANNTEHVYGEVLAGPFGQYVQCTCGHAHPVEWMSDVVPVVGTDVKLCQTCQRVTLCDQCRMMGCVS